jgi:hypothetical protein
MTAVPERKFTRRQTDVRPAKISSHQERILRATPFTLDVATTTKSRWQRDRAALRVLLDGGLARETDVSEWPFRWTADATEAVVARGRRGQQAQARAVVTSCMIKP